MTTVDVTFRVHGLWLAKLLVRLCALIAPIVGRQRAINWACNAHVFLRPRFVK